MPPQATNTYWQGFAKRWSRLGSPLRPCPEDVDNFRTALGNDPSRCLLLGVTPELAGIAPSLTAIDNSADMISALWPSDKEAVLGDWLAMPFPASSFDTIIGDGCLVLLSEPIQHSRFFEQVSNLMTPKGRLLLRIFVNPEQGEARETVCNDALTGKMKSFHAFKWRLSMAIASESFDHTLSVAETAATFESLIGDRVQLSNNTGWSAEDIDTIDFYRDSHTRYCYPTLTQVRRAIPDSLKEVDVIYGTYELAERCPILVLESRK